MTRTTYRTLLSIGIGMGTIVVAAALVVGIGTVVNLYDRVTSTVLMSGDDSVHADEARTMERPTPPVALAPLPNVPAATWTTPIGGRAGIDDGDAEILLVTHDNIVTALDTAAGTIRFQTPMPDSITRPACAIAQGRVGCVSTSVADVGIVVLDASSGKIVAQASMPDALTVQVGLPGPRTIHGTGERFIVRAGLSLGNTMAGFDLGGQHLWSRTGSDVFEGAGIAVDERRDGSAEIFRIHNGEPIAQTPRDPDSTASRAAVTWSVFANGIAVINADRTGTDFYRADGTKTASLKGWRPIMRAANAPEPVVPLVGRLTTDDDLDSMTIGAANPATGHVIWRATGSEYSARSIDGYQVGDLIALNVRAPGGDSSRPTRTDAYGTHWRVYDPYTGQARSVVIDADLSSRLATRLYSDKTRLIMQVDDALHAFDMASGESSWTLISSEPGPPQIGSHLFGREFVRDSDVISLLG